MGKKTVIISFDMEPDIGSWTTQDEGVKQGTPEILRVLANNSVPATFLFTGREAKNNPRTVEHILSEGHEIGCHTMFHETLGEAVFSMPGDNYVLPQEIKGRLELATEVLEDVSGIRPVSFRAPRLFGSTGMITALDELGYIVDSSFPSYYHGRDFLPYHPSREDWAKDGDMSILEIPPFYDTDAGSDRENRDRDQWPMMRLRGPEWFLDLARRMANVKDNAGNSIICIYLHPWEFIDMPETIFTDEAAITFKPFLHKNTGNYALNALDEVIGGLKMDGVEFATMKDFALTDKSSDKNR